MRIRELLRRGADDPVAAIDQEIVRVTAFPMEACDMPCITLCCLCRPGFACVGVKGMAYTVSVEAVSSVKK
jgi:hypothetical protein